MNVLVVLLWFNDKRLSDDLDTLAPYLSASGMGTGLFSGGLLLYIIEVKIPQKV